MADHPAVGPVASIMAARCEHRDAGPIRVPSVAVAPDLRLEVAGPPDAAAIQALERSRYLACDVLKNHQLRHLLRSPTVHALVVRHREPTAGVAGLVGNVIGFLRHFRIPSGRVYNIVVADGWQGKGLASRLLDEIEAVFRQRGMVWSFAEIRQSNAASRKLFARHGYLEIGPLPGYYPDGEDGVKVRKRLAPSR